MKKNLKKIENEVNEKAPLDEYRMTLEAIAHAELGLKFVESQECIDLEGEIASKDQALKYEHLLKVKRAERDFLEKLIKEK